MSATEAEKPGQAPDPEKGTAASTDGRVAEPYLLLGRTAVVVGAGSSGAGVGTGRAAALTFARHGAAVLAVDRDLTAAEDTAAMASNELGPIRAFQADVTDPKSCVHMVEAALDLWGRVDILDNNIGIAGRRGDVTTVDWNTWDQVMQINVKSMAMASAAAIPHMRRGSSIINIASISAFRPTGRTTYSTSKGAVIALSHAMALDHAAAGIRVNCIAPGPLYTPMMVGEMTDEARERRRLASPLQTEGNAWDVAEAALFLASDRARWITGVVLPVDGGVSLQSPDR